MDPKYLPFLIIPGFLIVFPLFWVGVVSLISRLSGWPGMAKRFRFEGREFPNERYASARIRVSNYKSMLRVGYDRGGRKFPHSRIRDRPMDAVPRFFV